MIEELLVYSISGIFVYSVATMFMYKRELKLREEQLRFKDAQIEELRHTLNLTMKNNYKEAHYDE